MSIRGRDCLKVGCACLVCGALGAPLMAQSTPVVLEETTKIVFPDPKYALAGPVALSGDRLLIGSTRSEAGQFRSTAFIYERSADTGAWSNAGRLLELGPIAPQDNFFSLALFGEVAAVAVKNAVHVFERTAPGWVQTALLSPPATALAFGSDVAMGLSRIVVGGKDVAGPAAYVFEKNASGQWVLTGQAIGGVASSDPADIGPQIDSSITRWILLGNPHAPTGRGALVFEEQENGTWALIERFPISLGDSLLGTVVAMSSWAAINSPNRSEVHIFHEEEPQSWIPVSRARPLDALLNDQDLSVDVSGSTIAMGVPSDEDRGVNSGSVSIYRQPFSIDDPFLQVGKLLASDAAPDRRFGSHVAIDGQRVVGSAHGAVYVFELPAPLEQPPLQQDDFQDGDSVGWSPLLASRWSVASWDGSRVFRQNDVSGGAGAVLEGIDWHNQSIEADARALAFNGADRWFGLMVRYIDANNYYYVTARDSNVIDLRRLVNGTIQTVASAALNVVPNRTYRLRLEAVGSRLRVFVNGRLTLEATDGTHTHGAVGLRMFKARAQYDNVLVSPLPAIAMFHDDFQDQTIEEWETSPSGVWSVAQAGAARFLRSASATGGVRAVTGVVSSEGGFAPVDQIVEADVRATFTATQSWFGLLARQINETSYVYVTVRANNTISLRWLRGGTFVVLDTAPVTVTQGTWYRLRFEVINAPSAPGGTVLRAYINGRLLVEAPMPSDYHFDNSDRGTRYGLVTHRAIADYDNVVVTQP